MSNRNRGPNSTGGTSKPLRREYDNRAPSTPSPADIGLLRGILAKRGSLSSYEVMSFTEMLAEAVKRPLSGGSRAWAERVALRVGAVSSPAPEPVAPAMSFGPLPLKPPGRAA